MSAETVAQRVLVPAIHDGLIVCQPGDGAVDARRRLADEPAVGFAAPLGGLVEYPCRAFDYCEPCFQLVRRRAQSLYGVSV